VLVGSDHAIGQRVVLDAVDSEDRVERGLRLRGGRERFVKLATRVRHAPGALPTPDLGHAVVARVRVDDERTRRPTQHIGRRLAAAVRAEAVGDQLAIGEDPDVRTLVGRLQPMGGRRQLHTPISDNYISPSTTSPEYPWQ